MASFRPLTPSDRCNTWPEVLALHGLSEGVSGSGARIGVIADGVSCFPTKADCRRIRGVPVFDGYTRMVARLMGSLAVLRSVSIPKGYRDFGFGSLRAVAPKNCPDVSG